MIKKKVCIVSALLLVAVFYSLYGNYRTMGLFANGNRKLPIYCVDTNEKKVAITFDASWGEDKTEEILKILDKYNVKATFFIVSAWADENPDVVKKMYDSGHEIANHSNRHPDFTRVSKERMLSELNACDEKLVKYTGTKTPELFRFPDGEYNDQSVAVVEGAGKYCIQWDVDSIDWMNNGVDVEYNRVVSKTKPGSIILFHTYGKYTPTTLPMVIETLKSQGYEFVKTGDLIHKKNFYMDNTGKQIEINN